MARTGRSLLLAVSGSIVLLLLGGGLWVKVGAADGSYRQAKLFAEILSQVLDNYVDPVEKDGLLRGAYDGMLGSLDPNGAYLTPEEVERWRTGTGRRNGPAGPGFEVLKSGASVQVVAVDSGSRADEGGVRVGDHLRTVDGVPVRNLSLTQARRLLEGPAGSVVRIELLHADDGFAPGAVELVRQVPKEPHYALKVERGTAVLTIHDLTGLPMAEVGRELEHARSRGVDRLLVDLRNLAGANPRDAAKVAAAFATAPRLELRDRSHRLVESVEAEPQKILWNGSLAVLVNGATSEGAEALTLLLHDGAGAKVFGETTFGLGAEPALFELQNGAGLLLSATLWETPDGHSWHESGIAPDEEVRGEGRDFASVSSDQLQRVLERLEAAPATPEQQPAAA